MNLTQLPTKGSRFVMHDTEYEIQYVHAESVRYSTINGGKTFSLSIDHYNSLLAENSLSITHEAELVIHEDNIKKLSRRMKYVKDILSCCGSYLKKSWVVSIIKATAEKINDVEPPSYHTARNWVSVYREHGQNGLIPQRRGNSEPRFPAETDMIIAEEIEEARNKGFVIIGVEVHAHVVNRLLTLGREQGNNQVKIPSVRLIQRRISAIDYYHRLIAQYGKAKANRLIRASGKKVIVPCPMSVVQIDTHFLDVIVVDPDTLRPIGRPYLVLIICVHSKKVVGHFISLFPPSATTTLQAVKEMLTLYGCPSLIIPDRGVEFINSSLFHLCTTLLVTLELSQVREPNHKANVESFFKTITLYLIQRLHGTTHSNTLERGDYDSMSNAIFTLDQVKLYVNMWINDVYELKPHSQTKRAPIAMWEKGIAEVPLLKLEEQEIENIARTPELKTVHSGRVMVNNLTYYSHALTAYNGKKVTVLVSEMDLVEVYIKDPEDAKTLIKADSTEPHYTRGLTLNQHKLVQEELKSMSQEEMANIGEHTWQVGLARLMDKIRDDALTNKKSKKAKNGGSASDMCFSDGANNPEDQPQQKANNQPRISKTKAPVYVDETDNAHESHDTADYKVEEL